MTAHPLLSPEWIDCARALHGEFIDRVQPPEEAVRMNVTVFGAPFSGDEILGHIDSTEGSLLPDLGHLDAPDVAVRVPFELAREMILGQEFERLMTAFMTGEIDVEGDVTMLMVLGDRQPTDEEQALADEISERIRGFTE